MDDLISRQAAIDGKISIQRTNGVEIYSDEAVPVEYLKALPSVQPDTDEWCHDCSEYDNDKHCCPRFNRVIRETLSEVVSQIKWERDMAVQQLKDLGYSLGEKPEGKTGHWVAIDDEPHEDYECDRCGFVSCATFGPGGVEGNKYNYCPNCGARMEE